MTSNVLRGLACFAPPMLALILALSTAAQPPNKGNRPQPKGAAVPEGVKVERDLEYARVGDKKLLLDLYLPEKAAGPLPVIVGIHGGGWANGSKAGGQGSWLARHGYAVAVIDYRLSGEAIFPAQIEDCKAAVRWLRANAKKYNLDPDRFGATGHSAGGHLTSLLATTGDVREFDKGDYLDFSGRIQAACPVSGPTDFLQMDAHAPKGARLKHDAPNSPEARLIGGPIQENKEKVAKANPITYVDQNDPPFLIVHGDVDPVVPAHQAELLHKALQRAGVEATLHLVPGAGHAVGGREVNDLIVAFFDKHLKSRQKERPRGNQKPSAGNAPSKTEAWQLQWQNLTVKAEEKTNRRSNASEVRQPVGIFVCRGPGPTPDKEVNFPFIDGWLVRPGWDKVEPAEGKYDWSYIDGEIAQAKRLKKKISLAVLGGPQAPDWVFKAGVKEIRYKLASRYRQNTPEMRIAPVWDELYLKHWTALVRALGQRYGANDTIALVHITGATGNGLEMQLPAGAEQQFKELGYTPEKVITAWKRIIDAYADAFPDKPLDIDIHPVFGTTQVAEEVAAYGSTKLGMRFGVFGGWLSGKTAAEDRHHAGMHPIAERYGKRGFSAWQMIGNETRQPERFAKGGLRTAIEQGLHWNGRYFEIWVADVTNEKLHPVLQEMAAAIRK